MKRPIPPRSWLLPLILLAFHPLRPAAQAQSAPTYSHGAPSAREQLLLELVNRARANPADEGARLNRAAEFANYPARPPLAFQAAIAQAARAHNNDMAARNFFSHSGSDNSQQGDRVIAAGYPGAVNTVGENLAYGFPSALATEQALMVDMGLPSLEHRRNYLGLDQYTAIYRETGIAYDEDSRALVTQDFASRPLGFVTGVAFQDFDGDNFYSEGEGVGGVSVSSPQSTFITVTSGSGGYALPMDKVSDFNAGVTVVFRDAGGATYTRRLALAATIGDGAPDNVKSDLRVGLDVPDPAPASTVFVVGTPTRGGFVLSRQSDDVSQPLTVIYHNGGSAIRDVDYVAFSGSATIPAGQTETVIPVTLLPGANRNHKVKVFLDPGPSGIYSIGKAQSKVFLSDL